MRRGYKEAVLLAATALALTLGACGSAGRGTDDDEVTDASVAEAQTDIATADSTKPQTQEAEDSAETKDSAYRISVGHVSAEYEIEFADKGARKVCETGYDVLLSVDGPSEVAAILDDYTGRTKDRCEDFAVSNGQDIYNQLVASEGDMLYWTDIFNASVERADDGIISIVETEEVYQGGVHGGVVFTGYNYDIATGREIEIDDVVTDLSALAEAIDDRIHKEEDYAHVAQFYDESSDETFADYLWRYYIAGEEGFEIPWTLNNDGLHIWFSSYMFGAYAFGVGDVNITYDEYPELFAEGALFKEGIIAEDIDLRIVTEAEVSTVEDLDELIYTKEGYMLMDYSELEGVYISDGGELLEIDAWGSYTYYIDGNMTSTGYLRANPGGMDMYEYIYTEGEEREEAYGSIVLLEKDSLDVSTLFGSSRFYYSPEQSDFMKYGGRGED